MLTLSNRCVKRTAIQSRYVPSGDRDPRAVFPVARDQGPGNASVPVGLCDRSLVGVLATQQVLQLGIDGSLAAPLDSLTHSDHHACAVNQQGAQIRIA